MPASSPVGLVIALAAATVAGAINAIAGGGTLVSFPAIVALGVPPLVANATNAVALWPGACGSLWAYRAEVSGARSWAARFAVPSSVGGAVGALLLLWTPSDRFERVVPFLVLGATVLFMAQGPITRRLRRGADTTHFDVPGNALPPPPLTYLVYQFGVGVYGGYFGAGIGILMLAVLGAMGLTNIHRMNGLKNWGALCINAVAALIFSAERSRELAVRDGDGCRRHHRRLRRSLAGTARRASLGASCDFRGRSFRVRVAVPQAVEPDFGFRGCW